MPLHAPPAPAAALRSILTALGSPTALRSSRVPAAVRTATGPLHPELPLPVHELARVAAHGRTGPPVTRLTGWRFLLREETGAPEHPESSEHTAQTGHSSQAGHPAPEAPGGRGRSGHVCAAEAVLTADGWAFGHFSQGPYVFSGLRALRQAESLTAAFQPRLLSVPELYMVMLWLHANPSADPATSTPGPADLLVPLAPAPPGIASHTSHRMDALLPQLTRRLLTPPLLRGTAPGAERPAAVDTAGL
ncbi:hypothetical protein [Streptomyces cacaoi]|uniref:hypothetical protein n=1 Tax=Streptomyces cacaoi TaxID=1898 RepID=UPI0011F306FB|nr:hypothetical protein [Streptomyces cacaoi]